MPISNPTSLKKRRFILRNLVALLGVFIAQPSFGQIHSSFEYNWQVLKSDSSQNVARNQIKKDLYYKKKFVQSIDTTYSFHLHFHNLSDIAQGTFSNDVANQIVALDRDFNMTGITVDSSYTYFEQVDTCGITFIEDPNATAESYAPSSVMWNDWDAFKFADSNNLNPDPSVIHIWVINTPDSIFNYSSVPDGSPHIEGIVLDVDFFGSTAVAEYNDGKTLSFLLGQFFGLEPLYGITPCRDDGVKDTPRHSQITLCNSGSTSCTNLLEMPENLMAQSPDACKAYFTKGQIFRIKYHIQNCSSLTSKVK